MDMFRFVNFMLHVYELTFIVIGAKLEAAVIGGISTFVCLKPLIFFFFLLDIGTFSSNLCGNKNKYFKMIYS